MRRAPWIVQGGASGARLRLYCFPYAGGSAASFPGWQAALGPHIEVCALQLPGRGSRFREPALTSMAELADLLARAIGAHDGLPYAFFGHSMGALLAFEVARRLRELGLPPPGRLFVSGAAAPAYRSAPRMLHRMNDDRLVEALRAYDGTPAEALADAELMGVLLPTIRADFAVVENFRYTRQAPLELPLTVLAGKQDTLEALSQVHGWQDETAGAFDVQWFDGGHFFIHGERAAVTSLVARTLAPLAAAASHCRECA